MTNAQEAIKETMTDEDVARMFDQICQIDRDIVRHLQTNLAILCGKCCEGSCNVCEDFLSLSEKKTEIPNFNLFEAVRREKLKVRGSSHGSLARCEHRQEIRYIPHTPHCSECVDEVRRTVRGWAINPEEIILHAYLVARRKYEVTVSHNCDRCSAYLIGENHVCSCRNSLLPKTQVECHREGGCPTCRLKCEHGAVLPTIAIDAPRQKPSFCYYCDQRDFDEVLQKVYERSKTFTQRDHLSVQLKSEYDNCYYKISTVKK